MLAPFYEKKKKLSHARRSVNELTVSKATSCVCTPPPRTAVAPKIVTVCLRVLLYILYMCTAPKQTCELSPAGFNPSKCPRVLLLITATTTTTTSIIKPRNKFERVSSWWMRTRRVYVYESVRVCIICVCAVRHSASHKLLITKSKRIRAHIYDLRPTLSIFYTLDSYGLKSYTHTPHIDIVNCIRISWRLRSRPWYSDFLYSPTVIYHIRVGRLLIILYLLFARAVWNYLQHICVDYSSN